MKESKAEYSYVISAVIGVNGGYHHNNEKGNSESEMGTYSHMWNSLASAREAITGKYISAVLTPSSTVYKPEWGCPKDGEKTINVSCTLNPAFENEAANWINAARDLITAFARMMGNKTVLFTITQCQVAYSIDIQEPESFDHCDIKTIMK